MKEKFDFSRISLGGPVFSTSSSSSGLATASTSVSNRRTNSSPRSARPSSPTTTSAPSPTSSRTRVETPRPVRRHDRFSSSATKSSHPESVWLPKKRALEETLALRGRATHRPRSLRLGRRRHQKPSSKNSAKPGSGRSRKILMLLRAVITGSATSPPLVESLVVFGKARSLDRMRRFLEAQKRARQPTKIAFQTRPKGRSSWAEPVAQRRTCRTLNPSKTVGIFRPTSPDAMCEAAISD